MAPGGCLEPEPGVLLLVEHGCRENVSGADLNGALRGNGQLTLGSDRNICAIR